MILGLDPGQRRDPAGLAILERLAVVHLARLPLGTSYPRVVERAEALAMGCEAVVVDATGVGRAVADMLQERGLRPKVVAVTLTGGGKVHVRDREVSLPRSALFQPLQAALEAGRLRVAESCPYAGELAQELLAGARRAVRGGEPGRGPPRRPDDGRGARGVVAGTGAGVPGLKGGGTTGAARPWVREPGGNRKSRRCTSAVTVGWPSGYGSAVPPARTSRLCPPLGR